MINLMVKRPKMSRMWRVPRARKMRSHLRLGQLTDSKHFLRTKKRVHVFLFGNQTRCWSHVFFLLISIVDVFFFSLMELQHITRWWFQTFFIFTTKWGDDPIWLAHIFQMGWFNHQLDNIGGFLGLQQIEFWKSPSFGSFNFLPDVNVLSALLEPSILTWNLKILSSSTEHHLPIVSVFFFFVNMSVFAWFFSVLVHYVQTEIAEGTLPKWPFTFLFA